MDRGTFVAAMAMACVISAAGADAQSLADAARLAEEQRAAAGRPAAKEYSNASLGGASGYAALLGDNFLLADHFPAYSSARIALAEYRLSHYDLDIWLFDRTVKAQDRFDLEKIYSEDSSVLRMLGRMTPRDYFKTDLAFARALEDVRLTKQDRDANLPWARAANAEYVADHNLVSWSKNLRTEQELDSRRTTYRPAYRR